MNAVQLLALIGTVLLIELALGVALAIRRRHVATKAAPAAPESRPPHSAPPSGWAGWREFRVVRREFEDPAQSQCSFHLVPVDGRPLAPFLPGQFLTFSLSVTGGAADAGDAARCVTRCYSLSDRPDAEVMRITVKRVPAPADRPELPAGLSSNHLHDHVRVGDVLQVKGPSGHFFIDPDGAVPVVLIAGGIGITPMMSMLAWCVAEQPQRPVHLYYGVRNRADHAFKQVLDELAASHAALRLQVAYSQPGADDVPGRDFHHAGRIDIDLLRRGLPHGRHQFYLCGPGSMMQGLVPALREWGVPEADIHFEAFGPASVRAPVPAEGETGAGVRAPSIDVRFQRSGRTLSWDGRDASLLDFAERHAVVVDSGCRAGGCGACETKLISGLVAYADTPDHEIAPGHCLLCVGTPRSALILEA